MIAIDWLVSMSPNPETIMQEFDAYSISISSMQYQYHHSFTKISFLLTTCPFHCLSSLVFESSGLLLSTTFSFLTPLIELYLISHFQATLLLCVAGYSSSSESSSLKSHITGNLIHDWYFFNFR